MAQGGTTGIEPLSAALDELKGVLSATIAPIKNLINTFSQLGPMLQGAVSLALAPIVSAVSGVMSVVVTEITAGLSAMVAELTVELSAAVAAETAGLGIMISELFAGIVTATAEVAAGIVAIVSAVTAAVAAIYAELAPVMPIILAIAAAITVVVLEVGAAILVTTALAAAIPALVASMFTGIGAIVGFGEAISMFVSKANPGLVSIFNAAVNDLTAVIGQSLAPTLRVVTQLVRMSADSLMTWLPQLGAVAGAILQGMVPAFRIVMDLGGRVGQIFLLMVNEARPAIEMMGAAFTQVLTALQPSMIEMTNLIGGTVASLVRLVAGVFQLVTPYITAFALVMVKFVDWVVYGIRQILSLLGLDFSATTTPAKDDSSTGMAATGANIGSVQSVIDTAMKNAFAIGGAAVDIPRETLDIAKGLKEIVDGILNALKNLPGAIWEKIQGMPGMLWELMKVLPSEIATQLATALRIVLPSWAGGSKPKGTT